MKRILFLLVAMCFMVPMEGCRLPPPASMSVQEEGRQMKDSQGVEVTIPDHPCRIVSIGVSTDDILIPLVGTDRIAAISYLPPNLEKEAARIPGRISGTTESVISFHPDLVVAADWNSKDYKDYIEEIRAVGIPVYVYRTQKDVEGMIALIHTLGNVVNEDEKADCFAADTKKRLDALTSFTAALPRRDTAVFYSINGLSGGKGSTFETLCRWAGFIDGAADWGIVASAGGNREALVSINPDIIFIPSNAYTPTGHSSPSETDFLDDPVLSAIPAVKNHRIYVVDAKWIMSYSQFMVNGMEEMAKDAYEYEIPENGDEWET